MRPLKRVDRIDANDPTRNWPTVQRPEVNNPLNHARLSV
jgi:hypothetical protein